MVYFEYEDIKCLFYSVQKAGNEKRIINLNYIRLNCKNYEKVEKSENYARFGHALFPDLKSFRSSIRNRKWI